MSMNHYAPTDKSEYVPTVSPEALLQEMRSHVPLTVVDVRDRPQIHESGAIADARTFPLDQLGARSAELSNLRSTRIVVVSQQAQRARAAALQLQAAGFGEVFLLEGGMQRWLELGYPVESRRLSVPPRR